MSETEVPRCQHISGVSAQNHSQAFGGIARDVYFAGAHNPQETPEQAARACRNALFLTDPHVDRERVISAKGTRVAGTCEWITHDAKYQAWLSGGNSGDDNDSDNTRLLWISGGPGKGKTMLSVFLTEELERHTARIDNADLAFFFCSAEDEKRNTAVAVLRGLMHQIIAKRPQLTKHALPYFETPERTQQTVSSLETLWIIFSKLVVDAELGIVLCVLDGLDECEENVLKVLLPRIVSLLTSETPSSTKGGFKLAIVSRYMPGLQGCMSIKLDPDNDEKVNDDIERFVSTRVAELLRIEGFNDDFRASVQTTLLKRAEGTFLWVGFAMHELLQKQTCSEIWEALEDLPSGLPAIYSRILLQIPAKQREVSQAILRWVTLAVRPLELRELAAAVGVQAASPRMTAEDAARDAVALCGPLLRLQKQEVSLVHQSARDYLLREVRASDTVLEAFRLTAEPSHLELARNCLDCIAQSSLQHRAINLDAELDAQESPLLRYATLHWPEHAKSCYTLAAKLFDPYGLFLKQKSPLRENWWTAYSKRFRSDQLGPPPLLHLACSLEVMPWADALLGEKRWMSWYNRRLNKKDSTGNTALHCAASEESEAVVRFLLDRGAEIDARAKYGETALHVAVLGGNEAMMRLLVDKGANVKAKDCDGATVLHWASPEGNEAIMRMLIGKGADVKAKTRSGVTVLQWAAMGQSESVIQLLVGFGADVKAKDNVGMTALHLASWKGREAIVRLLVDLGADINAKDSDGMMVLHSAALGGDQAVVRLLLELGADANAKDKDGMTVLHYAASRGSDTVVQLLVDLGADVKAKDNDGMTVTHFAVLKRNEKAVRLLLDLGADIEAKNKYGMTVLHRAAWAGDAAMVRLLVDLGADFNATAKHRATVLDMAALGKHKAIVRLLVECGADGKTKKSADTIGL
ncbi:hypothetical protein E8E12_000223 [Didymella heteroderae]|uniref:NACHT domain-containing protein n=1 Tax=Didymella heteroderae TaxID=1769908 RepID=A0A9P5BU11_9PLEO|nr:hypothetical protein E8E12_000223 [Didymella heteroderae]